MYKISKQSYLGKEAQKRAKIISENTSIPIELIYSKYRDYTNNWYEIDGKWYFYKGPLSTFHLNNELIGEEISKYFGLESVHYDIAIKDGMKGVISENFYRPNYKYKKPSDYNLTSKKLDILKDIKKICKTKEEYKKIKKELKRLFIRDLYTSQKDRSNNNLLFKEKNTISLAPLFDYEYSFLKRDIGIYFGVLGSLIIDKETKIKLQKDKEFQKYICLIKKLDILSIINKIENKNKIIISEEEKAYYSDYDKKIKKLIS